MRSCGAAERPQPTLTETLHSASLDEAIEIYRDLECAMQGRNDALMATRRELALIDRYYLLYRLLGRRDVDHPWIYARCREVEAAPDGRLDLWFRGGYKSTLITYAGAIQEILKDPEITIGIFSHTRPIAKGFLRQIKREFEVNDDLKSLYPDVLYTSPAGQSPQWSEDGGIVVRRQANPKEATLEAWGLVDGQPTAKHFRLRIYDDVVVKDSVTTPEQMQRTMEALELSQNLSSGENGRAWYIGTRYSFADSYGTLMDRGAVIPRIHPRTDDGTATGTPVLLSQAGWNKLKADSSESVIACQQLLNPLAGSQAMFQPPWFEDNRVDIRPQTLNIYILGDPAGSRKKNSDNTAIAVVGVDAANGKYLLDGLCHKLDLAGRWLALKKLYRYWLSMPGVQAVHVGYERYGMQADLEYFEEKMREPDEGSFPIRELAWPREGPGSKADRVQRLVPDAKNGRFHLPVKVRGEGESKAQTKMREAGAPYRIMKPIRQRDHDGNIYDLGQRFIQEATLFPFGGKDDLIDAVSRIYDMDYRAPIVIDESVLEPEWVE